MCEWGDGGASAVFPAVASGAHSVPRSFFLLHRMVAHGLSPLCLSHWGAGHLLLHQGSLLTCHMTSDVTQVKALLG